MTIGRLLATPVLVRMVAVWGSTWAAVVVAFCVCSTDGLDGWIARRQGATTSGAFLDPLADKAVVARHVTPSLRPEARSPGARSRSSPLREISMSVYRAVMSRGARLDPRTPSAKWKTVVQDLVLGLCLLAADGHHHGALEVAVWFADGAHSRYGFAVPHGWPARCRCVGVGGHLVTRHG